MCKRLQIAVVQVKAGYISENLLNEIRIQQHNKFNKAQYKMDTIFMNSGKSKTSDLHKSLLNLSDKIN